MFCMDLVQINFYCSLIQQHIHLVLVPMEAWSYLWVRRFVSSVFLSFTSLFCEQVSCGPSNRVTVMPCNHSMQIILQI